MAGRFALTAAPEDVATRFGLAAVEAFPPRPLILPTQPIMVILAGSEGRPDGFREGRSSLLVRWGLIPGWFRGDAALPALFNARAETAHDNAAFRGALRHRRCLVPASAFFRRSGGDGEGGGAAKGPMRSFHLADEPVFAMAGLMETYMAPDGSEIDTAAILTAPTRNEDRALVDRLPVTLAPKGFARWLDCRGFTPDEVGDLLVAPEVDDFNVETVG